MEEKEFNAYVDMFESDGWKKFMEQVDDAIKQLTQGAPTQCVTNDSWQFVRGQLHELNMFASYENFVRLSYEEQQKQAQLESEDNVVDLV